MIALSIRQPWAYAILHLGKDVENRQWRSAFRGRIVIHAAQQVDEEGWSALEAAGFQIPGRLTTGAYVGEVTVIDCVRPKAVCSDWACGPWCFTLSDPLEYPAPILGRGYPRFYQVPEGLLPCSASD